MKNVTLACGLLLATLWMQGCISVHSTKRTTPPRPAAPKSVPAAPVTAEPQPDDMTIREIDAVGTLASQSRRLEFYASFAGRTDLSPRVQVYLVETTFKRLSAQSDRLTVLRTLIANPAFSPEAKNAILNRLSNIASESDRAEILKRLTDR